KMESRFSQFANLGPGETFLIGGLLGLEGGHTECSPGFTNESGWEKNGGGKAELLQCGKGFRVNTAEAIVKGYANGALRGRNRLRSGEPGGQLGQCNGVIAMLGEELHVPLEYGRACIDLVVSCHSLFRRIRNVMVHENGKCKARSL